MGKISEKKLYWQDPELFTFQAKIVRVERIDADHAGIVLDRTAFYPESGGQPWDLGTIEQVRVVQVLEKDSEIVHIVERGQNVPSQGIVACSVDEIRRRDHMQQHTGQHILSQCFHRSLKAATISFHLGSDISTIDVSAASIPFDSILAIEDQANAIVLANLPVNTEFVEESEIRGYNLRKIPHSREIIRIVSIGDFDRVACGGTHVKKTGSVGIIKILRSENYKGNTRVYFCCGGRAIHDYQKKHKMLNDAALLLTCGWEQVTANIEKIKSDLITLKKRVKDLETEKLSAKAAEVLQGAVKIQEFKIVCEVLPGWQRTELIKLTATLSQGDDTIILLFSVVQGEYHAVFGRSKNIDLDLRSYLQEFLEKIGGKGGGKPDFVQGGGNGQTDIDAVCDDLINRLTNDIHGMKRDG